ncbi:MAG: tetratricopeptide repeat protein [Verrucomicrobia bacterium]|nr:MAG: tetratricopeptide repeat protein [Verrucomicrobiota bacterium]
MKNPHDPSHGCPIALASTARGRWPGPQRLLLGFVLLAGTPTVWAAPAARSAPAAQPHPRPSAQPFAPLPEGDPLAALWNDPHFQRRLLGDFAFRPSTEPALTVEEQRRWREEVVPLLRDNPTNAIPALRKAIRPDGSAVFDFTLGVIYFQQGDLTNAITLFETAVAKYPDYQRAWKQLGMARVRSGDYAAAIVPLGRALELGGMDAGLLGMLGFAHLNAGRPVAAAAALQQALLLRPDDFNLQLQLLQAWVASAQYDPALRLLGELIEQHPERANLWRLKASVLIQRNQLEDALVAYEMLRRTGGATAEDLFALGDLQVTTGAPELAVASYREAMEQAPEPGAERALRAAEVMVAQGRTAEATALVQAVRERAGRLPRDLQGRLNRLEAKLALAAGDLDRALQQLEAWLATDPLDGEALLLAGDGYARKGDRERAEFRYQAAEQLDEVAPDALVKHAQLLVRHREYRRAAELLQRAQKLKPREAVQRYLEQVLKLAAESGVSS